MRKAQYDFTFISRGFLGFYLTFGGLGLSYLFHLLDAIMSATSNQPEHYQHWQIGYGIIGMVALAEATMIISCIRYEKLVASLIFSVMLLFLGLCFLALKVTVDESTIQLRFGIGIIRMGVSLSDVLSCTQVRTFPLSGWGIRAIGRGGGWIYTVSGRNAVELLLKDNRRIRIGTNNPEELLRAIQSRINR